MVARNIRASTVGKARNGPTLPRAESDKALEFITSLCATQRYPVKFLAKAMGCSLKTAGRILSSTRLYSSPLKRAYAIAFASSVGCPLEAVTQPVDIEYVTSMSGWQNVNPASLATKLAAMLAAGIATRSMCVFNMPADFAVTHGPDGRPATVRVDIATSPGRRTRHSLIIAASDYVGGLLLTHLDEDRSQRCQVTPSENSIDRVLKSIKTLSNHGKIPTTRAT